MPKKAINYAKLLSEGIKQRDPDAVYDQDRNMLLDFNGDYPDPDETGIEAIDPNRLIDGYGNTYVRKKERRLCAPIAPGHRAALLDYASFVIR